MLKNQKGKVDKQLSDMLICYSQTEILDLCL